MQCTRCGNVCPSEARFCPRCGERLLAASPPVTSDFRPLAEEPAVQAWTSPAPEPAVYSPAGQGYASPPVSGTYVEPASRDSGAYGSPPPYPYPQGAAPSAYPPAPYTYPSTQQYPYPLPSPTPGYGPGPLDPLGYPVQGQLYGPQRMIEAFYSPDQLVTASAGRRLGAAVLDVFLFCITLCIGWFVWFCIAARNGQTPGKQLLGMYVLRDDGTRAGGWYIWLRELIVKGAFSIASAFTVGLVWLIAAAWCLWDKDVQCLWDKLGSTYVAHSPRGFKPVTRKEQQRGLLPR